MLLRFSGHIQTPSWAICAAGHDVPFVNNYGVWEDEFRELGLEHTLNATWKDALCYFGESKEVLVRCS